MNGWLHEDKKEDLVELYESGVGDKHDDVLKLYHFPGKTRKIRERRRSTKHDAV